MALFMGCPMWQHSDWSFQKYTADSKLVSYGRFFNSVEGNTTFYSLPNSEVAATWQAQSEQGFQFSFKFPRAVTHEGGWHQCPEFSAFMQFLEGFAVVGPVQIQLPNRFSATQLPQLAYFLEHLPRRFRYTVEVRHLDFFDKAETESSFNRLLLEFGAGRTLFDTRVLFHMPPESPQVIDGQRKKPKVPLHVISTADHVVVRYIGPPEFEANQQWFRPWVNKVRGWLSEGKDVYWFAHTPDNVAAPELALDMQQAFLAAGEGRALLQQALPQAPLF